VPEGGEEATGKLLRDDVVQLVPLARAEGLYSGEELRSGKINVVE
jgi:hypothetical protein